MVVGQCAAFVLYSLLTNIVTQMNLSPQRLDCVLMQICR